jgi:hypothetical protein
MCTRISRTRRAWFWGSLVLVLAVLAGGHGLATGASHLADGTAVTTPL